MPYEMIMYAGIATAAIGFVIAAVIFFQLKIPSVISDLTGRTARREIEELQHGGRLRGASTAAFHGLGETAETDGGHGVGTEELKPGARSAQQAESDRQHAKKGRGAAGKKRSKAADRAAGRNSRAGQFAGGMNPHPGGQYTGQNPAGGMNPHPGGQYTGQNPAGGMNPNIGGQFAGDMARYPDAGQNFGSAAPQYQAEAHGAGRYGYSQQAFSDQSTDGETPTSLLGNGAYAQPAVGENPAAQAGSRAAGPASDADAEGEAPTSLLGAAGTAFASDRDANGEAPTTLLGSGQTQYSDGGVDGEAPTSLLGVAGTAFASDREADGEAPTTLLGSGQTQYSGGGVDGEAPTTLLGPEAGKAVSSEADARTNGGLIIEVHDVVIHTDETLAGAS